MFKLKVTLAWSDLLTLKKFIYLLASKNMLQIDE